MATAGATMVIRRLFEIAMVKFCLASIGVGSLKKEKMAA